MREIMLKKRLFCSDGTTRGGGASRNISFETLSTPKSGSFSEIGYNRAQRLLFVRYRDSGNCYAFRDFPLVKWRRISRAKCSGRFLTYEIKDFYNYEKIYEHK